MPNVEWEVRHDLTTPEGTIVFNVAQAMTNYLWQLESDYSIKPALRVTQDNLSQQDGGQLHPIYKSPLVASLKVIYSIQVAAGEFVPACGSDLRVMHEELTRHLDALRDLHSGVNQRLLWYPTGYGDTRFIDDVQCIGWTNPSFTSPFTEVTFELASPFPYAVDNTQTTTSIADGVTTTLVNAGSSDFYPVIKAYGPTSGFTVTNGSVLDENGNPLVLDYDGTRPGAHVIANLHYVEFDFFRSTAFLDGSSSDRIAGINPVTTDFFPLQKGNNDITPSGCDIDVLWNNAWS